MYIFEVFSSPYYSLGEKIITIFAYCLALLTAFVIHEFSHSYVAVKMGDNTPKYNGRLTLNPVAHIDPVGFLMLFLVGFGWARPVPINPNNFKNYKSGMIWVSLAGVLANLVLAALCYTLMILLGLLCTAVPTIPALLDGLIVLFFSEYFYWTCRICLFLFAFNILPIYPLDGSKLLETILNGKGAKFTDFLKLHSHKILLGLIFLGLIGDRLGYPWLDILSTYVNFVSGLILKLFNLVGSLFV